MARRVLSWIMRRSSIFSHKLAPTHEDAPVTTTTPTALERAIQHQGDDLYRLALLLTPDEAQASAALALGGDLAHADMATRGHLALCGACRAAEQTWQGLTTTVENALRGALREIAFPDYLNDDLRAAIVRGPPRARGGRRAEHG